MDQTTTTTTEPPGERGMRIYPPLLALLCLLVALALHLMMPGSQTVFAHHVLGLVLVAGGVGLSFYAAAIFQARDTTKNPYGEPTSLVTAMPYTFTRNPMYVGLALVLFGLAVFCASVVMLLAPIVFVVVIDRLLIPREEENLEQVFGSSYADYKTRVRRWL